MLKSHLMNSGFEFFNKISQYNEWSKSYLNKVDIPEIIKKKYISYIHKNYENTSYRLPCKFYDLIATYKVLHNVTHSMKAIDILSCGISVINDLNNCYNILDFGCNTGYLASFYARALPNVHITGLDKSKKSILSANKLYNKCNYPNLIFTDDVNVLKNTFFDYIIDTQCLCTINKNKLSGILENLLVKLNKTGKLITVSNLSNENNARKFLNILENKGFNVYCITPIIVKNMYGIQAYTKIILGKKSIKKNYDLNLYYNDIRKKISIVKLSVII